MSKLVFYYDLLSQPARTIYMFLKMTNIPFDKIYIDLLNGKNNTEDFEKINPFKLIPVINDNGFLLTEIVAILEYVADKYQVDDHWFPKDLKKRAKVNSYLNWHHSNIRKYCSQLFHIMYLDPKFTGKALDGKNLVECCENLNKVLNMVEHIYLAKSNGFIAGEEEISIADLMMLTEIQPMKTLNFNLFEDRPRFEAWTERAIRRLGPVFDEAHQDFNNLPKIHTLN